VSEEDKLITVSAIKADWSREDLTRFWDPGRKLLKAIRSYQKWQDRNGLFANIQSKICVVRHLFWSVCSGADIPLTVHIGGGLLIPHPNGIVIHPKSVRGVNCLIHQQVTIGVKGGSTGPPVIHGHVDMGAGAKILGNIIINEHVVIGANSVVVKDVGSNAVVVGVPAKEIARVGNK
jgi:serine O-acetyltransferase